MLVNGYGKMFKHGDEQLESVPTPEQFTRVVDTLVTRYRISYFDAIMSLCDHHDREYESVKSLLTSKLKVILMEEMAQRRMIKDKNYLQHKLG
jgi:hypothetical protein